jgi:hypothetical protein
LDATGCATLFYHQITFLAIDPPFETISSQNESEVLPIGDIEISDENGVSIQPIILSTTQYLRRPEAERIIVI